MRFFGKKLVKSFECRIKSKEITNEKGDYQNSNANNVL